jgi:predicted Ser/Thr protein kinase
VLLVSASCRTEASPAATDSTIILLDEGDVDRRAAKCLCVFPTRFNLTPPEPTFIFCESAVPASIEAGVNCPSCGTELPDTAAFCMGCGAQLSQRTAEAPADPLREVLVKALGSNYEVMRLLGRGGMGAVYLARETALDRLVAVKVLPPEASDDQSRERFRREARTAAKLTHPNIVPLYSFGESDGMMYFVMGFVQGESLADHMARQGKIPEKDARRLLAEVADALHYAHTQNVVHRDIKPDNILIDDASRKPMLTDFGIAMAQAGGITLTAVGSIVGTPHYMSPEQASGDRDLDGRSDIYSLGVVAYRMLAGELPFDGPNLQDIIVQHVTKEAPNLKDVAGELSEEVARTVGRCLAKDPKKRWTDANEFRAAIRDEGISETRLPLSLRLGEGLVPKGVLTVAIGALALPYFYLNDSTWLPPIVAVTVGASLGGLIGWFKMLRKGKEEGYNIVELKSLAMRPPRWWNFAWPSRWRRPEDVQARLIPEIKKLRRLFGWAGTIFMVSFYLMILAMSVDEPNAVLEVTLLAAAAVLGGGGFLAVAVRSHLLCRKLGVAPIDLSKAIQTSTSRLDLWRSPELSRLLLSEAPPDERPKFAEPQTVHDFVEAIRRTEQELHGANGVLAAQAVVAAQQLMASVESVEREIARASSNVDEDEVSKLEARLEALGDPTSGKDDFDADMRELIHNQLLLHRRLAERLEAARLRHGRMRELLKLLWLNVTDLRAQQSQHVHGDSDITGKISAVCEDIERHVAATEETVQVLTRSGSEGV